MNQPAIKYLEGLHLLASQTSNLLTNKEVEQVQTLVEKCISTLSDFDKASFVKLLISFFKLFLHCPFTNTEMFYKKYYILLKEGFQSKSKNPNQQKLQCLIVTLFDTADKYYSSLFVQATKNSKADLTFPELLENILSINIKGGLNLKGFIALLRKYIQKENDNGKLNEIFLILKDIFLKVLVELIEDIKKNNKIHENYSFKFFFFNSLYEQFASRFEPQIATFLKDFNKMQISKSQQNLGSKAHIFLQFLLLNQTKAPLIELLIENGQSSNETSMESMNRYSYLMDIMASLLLFEGIHEQITERNSASLVGSLLLLKKRHACIGSQLKAKGYSNIQEGIKILYTQERSSPLEEFILDLFLKVKLHLGSLENSKSSPLSIIKTIVSLNSQYFLKNLINDLKYPDIFETDFYIKLLQDRWLTSKAKIYLILLYFNIFASHINDYSRRIVLENCIFSQFRKLISVGNISDANDEFFNELYMFMNFKTSKIDYLSIILGEPQGRKQENLISDIYQLYLNQTSNDMVEEMKVGDFIQDNKERFETDKFTFQNLIDLLRGMLQQDQTAATDETSEPSCQFNELSLILFDKVNIRPKSINKVPEEITFLKEKMKRKPQFCLPFFTKCYEHDKKIKSNLFFMKSIPPNELISQKIIVIALRKYFGMYYNRINELVIRKWIVNREYLTIWSLLLSNYKVKTIGEQILKCGISVQEIKGFFKIEGEIAKDFLEYLMSKDKYKFKLALYNCGLQHRQELISYSLPDLLL